MSKIGVKYISPVGLSFPAVNGGKWNLASNFRGDFCRILSESGVGKTDYHTVSLFMKFVASGMFLCAAKRNNVANKNCLEALWLFVPYESLVTSMELA
ncbi:MAG: hypothetical protein K2J87_05105, partial [Muribaculaceae bacterium]|nr:hypothetical protein [Muribaculaceae bacterium]